MSYTTVVKMTHRAGVCELAKNDKERRPILYLEHEDAAATHYFKEHGVGKRSLVPVNKNRASCARIKKLAGVPAVQADMRELVEAYDMIGQRFSVVWLDFQKKRKKMRAGGRPTLPSRWMLQNATLQNHVSNIPHFASKTCLIWNEIPESLVLRGTLA